jgi:DNA-binding transcriptional ArsR family regulator
MNFPPHEGGHPVSALAALLEAYPTDKSEAHELVLRLLSLGADPFAPCQIRRPFSSYSDSYVCHFLMRHQNSQELLEKIIDPYFQMAECDVPEQVVDACADVVLSSPGVVREEDNEAKLRILRRLAKLGRLHRDSRAPMTRKTRSTLLKQRYGVSFIEEVLEMTLMQCVNRILEGITANELSSPHWAEDGKHISTVLHDIAKNFFFGYLTEHEILEVLKRMVALGGHPFQPPPSVLTSMTTFECVATYLAATKYLVDAFDIMLSAKAPEHPAAQEIKRAALSDALITVVSLIATETEFDGSGEEVETNQSESYLLELIPKLIDAGGDVTVRTPENSTLLHEAACCLSAPKLKCMYPLLCLDSRPNLFSPKISQQCCCLILHWLL